MCGAHRILHDFNPSLPDQHDPADVGWFSSSTPSRSEQPKWDRASATAVGVLILWIPLLTVSTAGTLGIKYHR